MTSFMPGNTHLQSKPQETISYNLAHKSLSLHRIHCVLLRDRSMMVHYIMHSTVLSKPNYENETQKKRLLYINYKGHQLKSFKTFLRPQID